MYNKTQRFFGDGEGKKRYKFFSLALPVSLCLIPQNRFDSTDYISLFINKTTITLFVLGVYFLCLNSGKSLDVLICSFFINVFFEIINIIVFEIEKYEQMMIIFYIKK